MFEKIISKNTGDAASGLPSAPHVEPAPTSGTEANQLVAISAGKRNVLGSDVEIEGEVRFQGDLIVDGKIEGRIVSEGSLTIGESAHIKA
ncbi:MAG: polymer-forming cytoskeletal protein, partial [Verrucomicrobiota bacterium]|nr:polymer-forming cytoskeletal protein [Verrucomicrobiota bacterium]